jgi:Toxin SymE, type I toxin-antitoxin system
MAVPHSIPKSARVTDSRFAIASAKPSKDISNDHIGALSPSYCPRAAISPLRSRSGSTSVALPKLRHCTMGYLIPHVKPNCAHPTAPRLGSEPSRVPFLRLQGRWLHQAGFAIGTPVRVLVTRGRLVLEVDERA